MHSLRRRKKVPVPKNYGLFIPTRFNVMRACLKSTDSPKLDSKSPALGFKCHDRFRQTTERARKGEGEEKKTFSPKKAIEPVQWMTDVL